MSKSIQIIIGQRFGNWEVISEAHKTRHRMIQCKCDCGNIRNVYLCHLIAGKSLQCKECAVVTHGKSKTPTYGVWRSMYARCYNTAHMHYENYGGKGITICDEWLESFENFYSDMGEKPIGKSIDRIDGSLGYYKENCRWATPKMQSNNISSNLIIRYQDKDYTCSQLAEHLEMNYHTLHSRIKRGSKLNDPVKILKKKEK